MNENKKPWKARSVIVIFLIAAFVVILGIVIYASNQEKEAPVQEKAIKEVGTIVYGDEKLGIDEKVDKQLKDYDNIALLGIDAENLKKEKGHRSDAIIIVSVNKETNDVNLFSVYRDTYLKIDGEHGLDKVNHAYAYGGLEQSLWAINRNLDLNIREGIALSWEPIAKTIDDMGGIEVDIQASELNYLNQYLDDKNKIKGTGRQTLNGIQSVKYSRIRKDSSAGDQRRNERFKIILAAVLEKAKIMDKGKLLAIMNNLIGEAKSNMSDSKVTNTLAQVASYNLKDSKGWPYKTDGWMYNSIWYGVPITLERNVSQLHENMFQQKNYKPTDFVKSISKKIENQSGYSN